MLPPGCQIEMDMGFYGSNTTSKNFIATKKAFLTAFFKSYLYNILEIDDFNHVLMHNFKL